MNYYITSPGRTGSFLITDIIRRFYFEVDVKFEHINLKDQILSEDVNQTTIHTHNNNFVPLKNTKYIISTRNPIESVLSLCISNQNSKYHYYSNEQNNIVPFHVYPHHFLHLYDFTINWYITLSKELKSIAQIIDYSEFSEDPLLLLGILGLPELDRTIYNKSKRLVKTPGTYKDWISNWSEIEDLIKKLDDCKQIKT